MRNTPKKVKHRVQFRVMDLEVIRIGPTQEMARPSTHLCRSCMRMLNLVQPSALMGHLFPRHTRCGLTLHPIHAAHRKIRS